MEDGNPDNAGPEQQAVWLADGKHLPPVETRFPPGVSGNPGGRPKGIFDARAVLRRKFLEDPNEHGEGAKAVAHAERLEQAVLDRDGEAIQAETTLLHELAGRPQEHVSHSGEGQRTVILREPSGHVPPLPGEGVKP